MSSPINPSESEAVSFSPASLSAVQEPPKTLWEALRMIGPGIILAGTIVGSGELILTTAIGAKHGFAFLWLILFSCVIKVFVQIELGRYAISSGLPTLSALKSISTRAWIGNSLLLWWILMLFFTVFQLGGMTGGVGQSLHMAFPDVSGGVAQTADQFSSNLGDYVRNHVEMPWAFLTCLVTIAIIFNGSYRRIEGVTTILVVGVTLITVTATLALFATEFAPKWSEIGGGLLGRIPPEGIADAFAVFGITGVGATELFYYPYWCIEKGYGKFVGPNDGTEQWNERARGWIRVMHLDAWVSMVVFTLSTVAFYSMGAAVLHPQGLVPAGAKMIETLSQMYRGPFGDWTQILFLVGAGAVLFKTLYLACAANSRMVVDLLGAFQVSRVLTPSGRLKSIQLFCVLFPCIALGMYLVNRDPQYMVKLGGIAQAATLPMMAIVTLVFRYRKLDSDLRPSKLSDLLLWIATIAITVVAAYSVPDAIGRLFG
ncbi:Nramp family divalent metal transporter [Pirellulaceae bacterium SH467]|jgi:Mn2+/Fe2+ NRAMP family transporter